MKTTTIKNLIKSIVLFILCFTSFMWADRSSLTSPMTNGKGVYIITHDQIVRWGARNLEDVLSRIPGIRMATNSVQSRPASGPLVSSDSPTRIAASHFSRILILFNGHALNKYWHGGADHEWATGFIEGLKEIRVYTGPAAAAAGGGKGAMDMVIDLVPFTGSEQKGSFDLRLSQSLNEDRLDRSLLHFSTGNNWNGNGQYSIFGDFTQRGGFDISGLLDSINVGDRMERKDPSFQVGGMVQKGAFNLIARHMTHKHFDPYYVGRHWSATFAEAGGMFKLPAKWSLQVKAGIDLNQSTWGAASSASGEAVGDWDKVTETRFTLRAALKRQFKKSSIEFGVDYENTKIEGGPEREGDQSSVMNFSTRPNRLGADLRFLRHISGPWSLSAAVRMEKASNYSKAYWLPEMTLFYNSDRTNAGLSYAIGHRYLDSWYRAGSQYSIPASVSQINYYIVPVELKPEINRQVKLFFNHSFSQCWKIDVSFFAGKYSHLMGLDWMYTLEQWFNRLRASEVGNYSYWGGSGSLFYSKKNLSIGGNISYQGVTGSELSERQLYLAEDGNQPLFLSPLTANLFLDWIVGRNVSLSARFNIAGSAKNAGIDLYPGDYPVIFDSEPFIDSKSFNTLDVSLRVFNLWKKFEVQLSIHNALNEQVRLPMIEGGTFLSRGREITLTLRRNL